MKAKPPLSQSQVVLPAQGLCFDPPMYRVLAQEAWGWAQASLPQGPSSTGSTRVFQEEVEMSGTIGPGCSCRQGPRQQRQGKKPSSRGSHAWQTVAFRSLGRLSGHELMSVNTALCLAHNYTSGKIAEVSYTILQIASIY